MAKIEEFFLVAKERSPDPIPQWVREWDTICNRRELTFRLLNTDLCYGPGEQEIAGAVEDWLRQQSAMAAFRRRLYGVSE